MSLLQRDAKLCHCIACGAWAYASELCPTCKRLLSGGK